MEDSDYFQDDLDLKARAEKLYLCLSDLERDCLLDGDFNAVWESAAVLSMLERGWLRDEDRGIELTELGREISRLVWRDYEAEEERLDRLDRKGGE